MAYDNNTLEESIKLKLSRDYFAGYDTTDIIGRIDYAVAVEKDRADRFETEYLLWAEGKKGSRADLYESFVQLILTIGKERHHEKRVPPAYLGAFDAEKIAFIPFCSIHDVLSQNDFNWNVTPSDHGSREFAQLMELVRGTLDTDLLLFRFDTDAKALRRFIRTAFRPGAGRQRIRITKNNFIHIYQRWVELVKPTILVDWSKAKERGISDADFYLADILSENNRTLKEKLYVLLKGDHYELERSTDETGLFALLNAGFSDAQRQHVQFWNRYSRPPKREYWDYMVSRRDLLVDQGVREYKGAYFTPKKWVDLSQQYIAAELGEDWQEEYYVWDCAAGTGNLLNGLQNKYNIWASTLEQADVDVMKTRIRDGANLLESHVFQFDFLNDSFDKLPQGLRDIIGDEQKRKRLVVYINPPYAEAANRRTVSGHGRNKTGVARNNLVHERYGGMMGGAANEVFAQFLMRVYQEIPSCVLAQFSKPKSLQAPNFHAFRECYRAALGRIFIVPSTTFDNVSGSFPIGFMIWHTGRRETFTETCADVYDRDGNKTGRKRLCAPPKGRLLMDWLRTVHDRESPRIAYLRTLGSDMQNQGGVFLTDTPSPSDLKQKKTCDVTARNLTAICVYFAVRHCMESHWTNDCDQFRYPEESWKEDKEFQSDCIAFTLLHGQNRISARGGVNHWIPFTEYEVDAKERFKSRFMSGYIGGKCKAAGSGEGLFGESGSLVPTSPLAFSDEAEEVMEAGRRLWTYYHAQPGAEADASLYDIKGFFQGFKTGKDGKRKMNSESTDGIYMTLIRDLRHKLKALAEKIEPKVYEHGFLKK